MTKRLRLNDSNLKQEFQSKRLKTHIFMKENMMGTFSIIDLMNKQKGILFNRCLGI